MSLLYTERKNNNNANAFEQFYSQQNKNKEIANTNLPAGDSWNKGAPYADSTPSTVALSPTPVTVNTTNPTSTASSNSTPLVGFSKNPQQSYSYVNAYIPSTKKTTTPTTSSQTTPTTSSTGGDKTNTPSTQSSSLTKDPTTGIIYKDDGTVYSQPSIYNAYGQNGALAKSAAAKKTGVLDATTRKALEGIAAGAGDAQAMQLAAQELKYWNDLAKEKEKKLSLADLMALFNDADNYTEWLNKYGTDTEAARAEAYKNRMAEFDRNRSTYGRNAENLAQLGLTNSGYSDYLDGVGYAAYIAGLSDADGQKAMQDAEYARQYAQYLTEKEAEAKQQAMALYGSVMSGELTAEQSMEYAKFLGASDEDAQAVYNSASKVASTVTQSKNNSELNSMAQTVLGYVTENGYGVDTTIKMLYPDATEEQKKYIENYITDVENTFNEYARETVLKNLKNYTTALTQQITAGNADISGYVTEYNSLLSQTDPGVLESGKAILSESLKNDLLKLYDDPSKAPTFIASYIKANYGTEEDDSGMSVYNSKSADEQDQIINEAIDELYNKGNGVLNEEHYNELKYLDFKDALESSDSLQEIASLAQKIEDGLVGTKSIIEKELDELSNKFENVHIESITSKALIVGYKYNGEKRISTCKIKLDRGEKINSNNVDLSKFTIYSEGEKIYIANGTSVYNILDLIQTHKYNDSGWLELDEDLTEEVEASYIRLLARKMN